MLIFLNRLLALCLVLLGLATVIRPDIFSSLYGIGLPTADARITLAAIIGGGEMGIAAFLLLSGKWGVSHTARAVLSICILSGVVVARLIACMLSATIGPIIGLELVLEVGAICLLVFAVQNHRKSELSTS